jgi:hypothetical protein
MAIMNNKPAITKRVLAEFNKTYEGSDEFYGKAFYKHFRLARIVDQSRVSMLKSADRFDTISFIALHMKVN